MLLKRLLVFSSVLLCSLTHFASATNVDESIENKNNLSQNSLMAKSVLETHKWYKASKKLTVHLFQDLRGSENLNTGNGSSLEISPETELSVMDLSEDGQFALIGIDEEALANFNPGVDPQEPTIAWVSTVELPIASLALIDVEEEESKPFVSDDGESDFAANGYLDTEVASRGGAVHARRRGGKKMTYCLRDVRLTAARFTRAVPRVAAAAHAYGAYLKAGWRPVSFSESAPRGTSCFSGGGRRSPGCCPGGHRRKGSCACGHAAIKIGSNTWKGAGIRHTPWISGRNPIGCLRPPGR